MIELNVTEVLAVVVHTTILASLIYFFYLAVRHGELLYAGEAGPGVPLVPVRGEPEHAASVNVLDEIAAAGVRLARAAR